MQHLNSLALTTLTEKYSIAVLHLRAVKSVGISNWTVKFQTTQSARPPKLFSNTWMMNLSLECFPVGTYCFFHKCGPLSPPFQQNLQPSHHLPVVAALAECSSLPSHLNSKTASSKAARHGWVLLTRRATVSFLCVQWESVNEATGGACVMGSEDRAELWPLDDMLSKTAVTICEVWLSLCELENQSRTCSLTDVVRIKQAHQDLELWDNNNHKNMVTVCSDGKAAWSKPDF